MKFEKITILGWFSFIMVVHFFIDTCFLKYSDDGTTKKFFYSISQLIVTYDHTI